MKTRIAAAGGVIALALAPVAHAEEAIRTYQVGVDIFVGETYLATATKGQADYWVCGNYPCEYPSVVLNSGTIARPGDAVILEIDEDVRAVKTVYATLSPLG